MSSPVKRDPLDAMIDFASEYEQTPDEAIAELREAGVDVSGFLGRVHARVQQAQSDERLARLRVAQALAARTSAVNASRTERYDGMTRSELMHLVKSRPAAAQASFCYKLDNLSDDDLRVMLEDLDEVEHSEK